jgi:hypothetical protein
VETTVVILCQRESRALTNDRPLSTARVAVHFNAVCERFSPYDSSIEIAVSDELKDSKLSAACSLHASSGSNSSSASSQRRKHLMEIAEEDEEENKPKRQSILNEEDEEVEAKKDDGAITPSISIDTANIPDRRPKTAGDVSTTNRGLKLDADLALLSEHRKLSAASAPTPTDILIEDLSTADTGRRMSSQSGRAESTYSYKPKVKLGPRPSLDTNVRPQTAGNFRPVSSIPAGFKLFGKNTGKKGSRKGSVSSAHSTTSPLSEISDISFASTIPIPEEPPSTPADSIRPVTSSGVSMKSTVSAKSAMTPEKARLKKAMQLREKKKKKAAKQAAEDSAAVTAVPQTGNHDDLPVPQTEDGVPPEQEAQTETSAPVTQTREPVLHADSGIAIDTSPSSAKGDRASERTQSDSQATSPIVASDAAQSTKASSISDSTDLTVEANADSTIDEKNEAEATPRGEKLDDVTPETVEGEVTEHGLAIESEKPGRTVAAADEARDEVKASVDTPTPTEQEREVTTDVESAKHSTSETLAARKDDPAEEHAHSTRQAESIKDTADAAVEEEALQTTEAEEVTRVLEAPAETTEGVDTSEASLASAPKDEDTPVSPRTLPVAESGSREPEIEPHPDIPEVAELAANPVGEATQPSVGASLKSKFIHHVTRPSEVQTVVIAMDMSSVAGENNALRQGATDPDSDANSDGDSDSDTATARASTVQPVASRRKLQAASGVQPIRTDMGMGMGMGMANLHDGDRDWDSRPTSQSELDFSDDDSLLEELQSATVQEAKPMFVAKTPLSPRFPGSVTAAMAGAAAAAGAGGDDGGAPSSPPHGTAAKPHLVRTVSNPVRGSLIAPPSDVSQSSARSLSQGAAYLHRVTQQETSNGANANLSKKTNMGSKISQRIKALEQLSANTGDASAQVASRPGSRPSSTFFSVKPGRTPSRSPSVLDRANSFSRGQTPPSTGQSQSQSQSRESSPETLKVDRDRSGSMASRLSMFEPGTEGLSGGLSPSLAPRGRPESIQVTARIIRDGKQEVQRPQGDFGNLELRQSAIVVDHHKAVDGQDAGDIGPGGESLLERRASKNRFRSDSQDAGKDSKSQRSSISIVKDFIKDHRKSIMPPLANGLALSGSSSDARSPTRPPSAHQSSGFSRRLSIGSRRSLSIDRGDTSPAAPTETSASGDDSNNNSSNGNGDKKKSRTGRLMRRLSNLSSSRGKVTSPHVGTPTVKEEASPFSQPGDDGDIAVQDLGDVNVQFPDTLLWKRRNMCLSANGFVILSASMQQSGRGKAAATAGVKRYHLSEFKPPYIPDVEVQELPNSVVLELLEGSAVQIACEDRAGQIKILQRTYFREQLMHETFGDQS